MYLYNCACMSIMDVGVISISHCIVHACKPIMDVGMISISHCIVHACKPIMDVCTVSSSQCACFQSPSRFMQSTWPCLLNECSSYGCQKAKMRATEGFDVKECRMVYARYIAPPTKSMSRASNPELCFSITFINSP